MGRFDENKYANNNYLHSKQNQLYVERPSKTPTPSIAPQKYSRDRHTQEAIVILSLGEINKYVRGK